MIVRGQHWRDVAEVPPGWGPSVVTIGVFDGVHLGHRVVLRHAVAAARRSGESGGLPVVVVTFDPHPMRVVRLDAAPELLGTVECRVRLLGEAGADAVLVLPFTRELSQLTPEEFARQVLADVLNAAVVVVGEDFRFGHRAAGDVPLLRKLGKELGFVVEAVAEQADSTERYSSSRARRLLLDGDVEEAARVLGRWYAVEGVVVEGDNRGRALGFPTANLKCPEGIVVPADGVYAGWLVTAPFDPATERLPAAVSVGSNPTFPGAGRRVEAYVLDRDDLQLYGQHVAVEFAARLRGMRRFASVEELRAEMAADVAAARRLLL